MRETLLDVLQFMADDFAEFPRLPIVLGITLAMPAYLLVGVALVAPAFSLGLLGGLAWAWRDDSPWF